MNRDDAKAWNFWQARITSIKERAQRSGNHGDRFDIREAESEGRVLSFCLVVALQYLCYRKHLISWPIWQYPSLPPKPVIESLWSDQCYPVARVPRRWFVWYGKRRTKPVLTRRASRCDCHTKLESFWCSSWTTSQTILSTSRNMKASDEFGSVWERIRLWWSPMLFIHPVCNNIIE